MTFSGEQKVRTPLLYQTHTHTHVPCVYYLDGLDYECWTRNEEFH